ncbi:hypothetical protein E2C01_072723 [Portunus trituberculatus]|uniref:Uncharacterized protein n=1 Tax=Portunus trituberculatus TaxID=210409 RepID=A0A5B7I8L9_PORTR|nr:hypothetical protein [Portunus trituberculatus]
MEEERGRREGGRTACLSLSKEGREGGRDWCRRGRRRWRNRQPASQPDRQTDRQTMDGGSRASECVGSPLHTPSKTQSPHKSPAKIHNSGNNLMKDGLKRPSDLLHGAARDGVTPWPCTTTQIICVMTTS